MGYKMPRTNPFDGRCDWEGKILTLDGSSTADFGEDDLDEVVWSWEDNPRDWDGNCACVCLLKDGRFISWESWWGPTGDGFSRDAYGGDTDLSAHSTLSNAMLFGLTPERRKMCAEALGIPIPT